MTKTLKQTIAWAASLLGILLVGAWCVYDMANLVHREKTKDVFRQFSSALDQAEKKPPGLARAETLLSGLRAIDPGYAPGDVKAALAGYTAALEGALDAAKAGKDTSAFDREMAAQKQKFTEAILSHK